MADSFLRLLAITQEIRSLPGRGDSEAERYESAGRLLLAAIDIGAFANPKHAGLGLMVQQRAEQKPPTNGPISAFTEAVWRLAGQPDIRPDFAQGCNLVADAIQADGLTTDEPGSPLDEKAWVPMSKLDWPDQLPKHRGRLKFLKAHEGEISHKLQGKRHYVHAGDWASYWAKHKPGMSEEPESIADAELTAAGMEAMRKRMEAMRDKKAAQAERE